MSLPTSSSALIESNRQNAQLSTGPRSVAGKARSSHNAVSHGLFAKTLVLHGEDATELDLLRQSLRQEHQPATETEALLVERIVVAAWKLRRLSAAEQALFELEGYADLNYLRDDRRKLLGLEMESQIKANGQSATVRPKLPSHVVMAMSFRGKDPLEKVQLHEQRLENSIHRNLKQLRDLRKQKAKDAELAEEDGSQSASSLSPCTQGERAGEGGFAQRPTAFTTPPTLEEPLSLYPSPPSTGEREVKAEPYAPIASPFDESNPNPALNPENIAPPTLAQVESNRLKESRRCMKELEMLRQLAFPRERRPKTIKTCDAPRYFSANTHESDNFTDFDAEDSDFGR